MRILGLRAEPRRTGCANADVATYESVLSLPRKKSTSCGVSSSPLSRRSHRPPGNLTGRDDYDYYEWKLSP